jgi:hypothetical protein
MKSSLLPLFAFIESHVGKIGVSGTLATLTLGEWSIVGGLCVAATTVFALLPVGLVRWRRYWRGEAVESNDPFPPRK